MSRARLTETVTVGVRASSEREALRKTKAAIKDLGYKPPKQLRPFTRLRPGHYATWHHALPYAVHRLDDVQQIVAQSRFLVDDDPNYLVYVHPMY